MTDIEIPTEAEMHQHIAALSRGIGALEKAALAKSREPELKEARRKLGDAESRLANERTQHQATREERNRANRDAAGFEERLERLCVATGLPMYDVPTSEWFAKVDVFAQELKELREAQESLSEVVEEAGISAEVIGEGTEIVAELKQERDAAVEKLRLRDAVHAVDLRTWRKRADSLATDRAELQARLVEMERELRATAGRTREIIEERTALQSQLDQERGEAQHEVEELRASLVAAESERDDLERRLNAALTRVGELDRELRLAQQKGSDKAATSPLSAILESVPPELVREVGRFFTDRK